MSDHEDVPDNPFDDTEIAWISVHEMFKGMMSAGFTESQACAILGTFISHQVSAPDEE